MLATEQEEALTFRPTDALSVRQFAELAGVCNNTGWVYVVSGRVRAHRIAGRYIVLRTDALAFLREREAAGSLAATS